MDKETLNKLIKKLNLDKEKIMNDINMLPNRFINEFIGDVLVDEASLTSFNKVFSYYIADIWEDLTNEEKIPFEKKFLIISL